MCSEIEGRDICQIIKVKGKHESEDEVYDCGSDKNKQTRPILKGEHVAISTNPHWSNPKEFVILANVWHEGEDYPAGYHELGYPRSWLVKNEKLTKIFKSMCFYYKFLG